jgi:hypothetical protein
MKMSEAGIQISGNRRSKDPLAPGSHSALLFESQSDKQERLFSMCRDCVGSRDSYLLYIAGKQGVKGIRLSLKDVGFDVASFEKKNQMKIVDSEAWFVSSARLPIFKPFDEIYSQFREVSAGAGRAGFHQVTIISETDMIVRKKMYPEFKEFDKKLRDKLLELNAALVCGFDRRELQAAGIPDTTREVSEYHTILI